jgi:hypothetical protein
MERLVLGQQGFGFGPSDLYAVGAGGNLLHSTGEGSWRPQATPTTDDLLDVFGTGFAEVFAVGANALVLHKKQ